MHGVEMPMSNVWSQGLEGILLPHRPPGAGPMVNDYPCVKPQLLSFFWFQVDALRLRLEEKESFLNKKTKQLQDLTEEKGTLAGEIRDMKDMLEVKERKINVLQKKVSSWHKLFRYELASYIFCHFRVAVEHVEKKKLLLKNFRLVSVNFKTYWYLTYWWMYFVAFSIAWWIFYLITWTLNTGGVFLICQLKHWDNYINLCKLFRYINLKL